MFLVESIKCKVHKVWDDIFVLFILLDYFLTCCFLLARLVYSKLILPSTSPGLNTL